MPDSRPPLISCFAHERGDARVMKRISALQAQGWRLRQGGEATFSLPHEKRMLASLLGMTPENLSRAFSNLADYGVEVNGPEVSIHRPAVLDRLAKPDRLIDSHLPDGDDDE